MVECYLPFGPTARQTGWGGAGGFSLFLGQDRVKGEFHTIGATSLGQHMVGNAKPRCWPLAPRRHTTPGRARPKQANCTLADPVKRP